MEEGLDLCENKRRFCNVIVCELSLCIILFWQACQGAAYLASVSLYECPVGVASSIALLASEKLIV